MTYKVKVLWICLFLISKNNVERDSTRSELYKHSAPRTYSPVPGISGIMSIRVKTPAGFNVLNFCVICCRDKKVLCGNNN